MDYLVTGESLGQVASQTLKNIRCENPASSLFIVRPLIGLDKIEIESLARKFGTYEISILPGTCCSMAPKYPVTYSNPNQVNVEENKLNLSDMVENARKNTKIT
jgi:thiamine biosynthesis protein ThiI